MKFAAVGSPRGSHYHWVRDIGSIYVKALCGKKSPKYGWLIKHNRIGTCSDCIKQLPKEVLKEHYPVTADLGVKS